MQDSTNSSPNAAFPIRSSGHRRAHSEVQFRLAEDMDLVPDELISEDDLFCSYMDIEKLGSRPDEGPSGVKQDNSGHGSGSGGGNGAAVQNAEAGEKANEKPRHRYSNSVDGSSIMEAVEAKKAMSPDKLAELWAIDPKRAKRIIANRQSASRSKERKARYISELERKVQTLQTEATTLSAQLMLFQRDTTGLSTENTELKIRLQAMEQQAQLRDALNEALKKEVERLKLATGETMTPTESYNLGMQHSPTHSSFLTSQPQPGSADSQFNPYHSNPSTPRQPQLNPYHSNTSTPRQPLQLNLYQSSTSTPRQPPQLNPYQSNPSTPRQPPQLNPYQSNPSTPHQPPQLNPYQSNPSTPRQPQPNPYHSNPSTPRQPQFNPYQSNPSTPRQPVVATSPSDGFSDMLAQDPLRRMQGLDIGSRSSHLVKYKCPSISTSEGCGI